MKYLMHMMLALLIASAAGLLIAPAAALGETPKTGISIDCAATQAAMGVHLCSALRDAVDQSPKYREASEAPAGYALRIVAVDINDSSQTAVSMTLLYRWSYVSSAVQVCSPADFVKCAQTMMSSVDEDITSLKKDAADQLPARSNPQGAAKNAKTPLL